MSSITLNMQAIENHPEHIALYKLCIAGVGFREDGKYTFISHYGDYIGEAPIYRVESFVAFMKRRFGVTIDCYPMDSNYQSRPITYGWQNLVSFDIVEQWMQEMFENEVKLV